MVPVAVARVMVGVPPGSSAAFPAALSFTSKVSLGSSRVSSVVVTETVFSVTPAAKVRVVKATAVKSAAVAWPVTRAVAHFTVTTFPLAPARVTVKLIAFPSSPLASATEKLGVASSSVTVTFTAPAVSPS